MSQRDHFVERHPKLQISALALYDEEPEMISGAIQ